MSATTKPRELPAQSTLQALAYEALDDAQRAAAAIFSDVEASVAVSCTQAIVLAIGDLANELRANRGRLDEALAKTFGPADRAGLEQELQPNGEGYRSAGG